MGALQAAAHRPIAAAYYSGADLIEQAAILAIAISQAQAFVDGNKRAAFQALDLFLYLNGKAFVGEPLALADQLIAVAEASNDRETAEANFLRWLNSRVIDRNSSS
jgi:death-on-curing protein